MRSTCFIVLPLTHVYLPIPFLLNIANAYKRPPITVKDLFKVTPDFTKHFSIAIVVAVVIIYKHFSKLGGLVFFFVCQDITSLSFGKGVADNNY